MSDLDAIYQQFLGRAPDANAQSFYSGMGTDQIRNYVMQSPEFLGRSAVAGRFDQPAAQNKPTYGNMYDPSRPWSGVSHLVNGVQIMPGAPGYNAQAALPWHKEISQYAARMGLQGPIGSVPDTWTGTGRYFGDSGIGALPSGMSPGYGLGGNFGTPPAAGAGTNDQPSWANVPRNQPENNSPVYSPTSRNGFGQGWGGSNPFKIGSF